MFNTFFEDGFLFVFILGITLVVLLHLSESEEKCYEYEFEYKNEILKTDTCYFYRFGDINCYIDDTIYRPNKVIKKEIKCKRK